MSDDKITVVGDFISPAELRELLACQTVEEAFVKAHEPTMPTRLAPYHLVQQPHGVLLELISYPYEDDHGHPVVKVRSPGDPTTIATHDVGKLEPVVAECRWDQDRWDAVVTGEFKDCHMTCPRCSRDYFAVHDDAGKFLWFECPVFRRDPPAH